MPTYSAHSIDPLEHWDDECAFCGVTEELAQMDVWGANQDQVVRIPGCRSCRGSLSRQDLLQWLLALQDQDQAKWQEIFEWQKWKQTSLAVLVRRVSQESA